MDEEINLIVELNSTTNVPDCVVGLATCVDSVDATGHAWTIGAVNEHCLPLYQVYQ